MQHFKYALMLLIVVGFISLGAHNLVQSKNEQEQLQSKLEQVQTQKQQTEVLLEELELDNNKAHELKRELERKNKQQQQRIKKLEQQLSAKREAKRIAEAAVPAVSAAPAPTPAPTPAPANNYGRNLAEWLRVLRMCESGGNYAINTGNGFYGAYQFMISTWDSVASRIRPDLVGVRPDLASPADQDYMIVENTKMSAGGLSTQNPGCYKKHGLSVQPPGN